MAWTILFSSPWGKVFRGQGSLPICPRGAATSRGDWWRNGTLFMIRNVQNKFTVIMDFKAKKLDLKQLLIWQKLFSREDVQLWSIGHASLRNWSVLMPHPTHHHHHHWHQSTPPELLLCTFTIMYVAAASVIYYMPHMLEDVPSEHQQKSF